MKKSVVIWLVTCFISVEKADLLSVEIGDLYSNVKLANTTECLEKLLRIPLKHYNFAYDPGRRQLGPLGAELQGILPEAVEFVRSRAYPNPDKSPGAPPTVKAENIKVVDKNMLFTLGLGATQELIRMEAEQQAAVDHLMAQDGQVAVAFAELERRLAAEADAAAAERRALAAAERAAAEAEGAAGRERAAREAAAREAAAAEEAARLAQQDALLRRRLEAEARAEAERTRALLDAQAGALEAREGLRREGARALREAQAEQDLALEQARLEAEVARAGAEARARAAAERENEDLALRRVAAEGQERRRQAREAVGAVFAHLGAALGALAAADPRRWRPLAAAAAALAGGYFALREAAALLRQVIEARLGKPRLVRETSRLPWWSINSWFPKSERQADSAARVREAFEGVVLPPILMEQVASLAVATRNARRHRAPHRHALLYGPPGTGKTMVAKRLAECSGMDYAVMSGGDVGPLGRDAVTALHALFRWAARSRRGLLLFVDEAEAFLGSRSLASDGGGGGGEDRRNALNALLFQTGTQGAAFMMVLATNRAEDLDSAILDRIDDSLFFPFPGERERQLLVNEYYGQYILNRSAETKKGLLQTSLLGRIFGYQAVPPIIPSEDVTDKLLKDISLKLDGFSGREISKLLLSVQNSVYGSGNDEQMLTKQLLERVVTQKLAEHAQKVKMIRSKQ